ncbi:hypothetical protein CAEBREN_08264 [Caenorhabditis brenneri]|uniref:Uncharacterized protein n=1 Tax=Caenorhabditis brenneri TaxID=135651 RepID=G0NJ21_CAEBE|nr:hypothetical protein CAEBREN_08264 [Caenorhabditis brenneri]
MNEHCRSSSHHLNNNHSSSLPYPTTTAESFLTNPSAEYIDYAFRDPSLSNLLYGFCSSGVSYYDEYQNQFRCSSLNSSVLSQCSSSYEQQNLQSAKTDQNNPFTHDPINHGNSSIEAKRDIFPSANFGQQLHTITSILEKKEVREAGVCANCGDKAVKDECFKCHTYKIRYNKPRPKRLWKKKVVTTECNNCGIPTTRASCQACYKYKRCYGIDRPERFWKKRIGQYKECTFCKRTVTSQWYKVGDKKQCPSCYFKSGYVARESNSEEL